MFKKEKFFPALVVGFSLAVLSLVPIIQITSCCLLAPLAGIIGINLYYLQMKNIENFKLQSSDGVQIGILTGIITGFFESILQSILILVSKTNPVYESIIFLQKYFSEEQIPGLLWQISRELDEKRFSFALSFILFINTTIIYSIFTTIGSLIAVSKINKRNLNI